MITQFKKTLKYIPIAIFLMYLIGIMMQAIDILDSQLGFYLKEGEFTVQTKSILEKNHFTYTTPEAPFYNNNWLACVFLYMIYTVGDFIGLHLFAIISLLGVVGLFIRQLLREKASPIIMGIAAILIVPMLTQGFKLEPKLFVLILLPLHFYVIRQYMRDELSAKFLIFIPVTMLLLCNMHEFFMLTNLLLGLAVIQGIVNVKKLGTAYKIRLKWISITFILTLLFSCLNNNFITGIITASQYLFLGIVDGQPVANLLKSYWSNKAPKILYFIALLVVFFLSVFYRIRTAHDKTLLLELVFGCCLVFLTLINYELGSITIMILFFIAALNINAFFLKAKSDEFNSLYKWNTPVAFLYILLPLFISINVAKPSNYKMDLGISETQVSTFTHFVEKNDVKGPIFNNIGLGSFLVWKFYPKIKPYVLSKQTIPESLIQEIYFPKIRDLSAWENLKNTHKFNAIFFLLEKETEDNLRFLGERLEDEEWALVYHEPNKIAILLRRNSDNNNIINQYEIIPEI